MISKLEKLEILGENVLKFWDKDKIYCELKIKNPEYIIKTKNIDATNQDIEDFKMHITDLLKFYISNNKITMLTKYTIHLSLEYARGILNSKWHN